MFPTSELTRRRQHVASTSRVQLLGRELCGDDILTCRFSRPEGYAFAAGQWLRLTVTSAAGPDTRTMSHCSGSEDPYLDVTTRLSLSPFKVALAALDVGGQAEISGPGGRLALPADERRVCFLVGGVGITPVRSILRHADATNRTFDDALLLYGNRDESCVPFAEEFAALKRIGVRMVICYEQPPAIWEGERGFITAETVRRHVDPDDGRPFVVAGPPVMVAAMERVLDDLGVSDGRRLVERFGAKS
jgi:ferredoxin-NADP reductase